MSDLVCREGGFVNYCRVHMSSWSCYDDNVTPCDLARAQIAEGKVKRVQAALDRREESVSDMDPAFRMTVGIDIEEIRYALRGESDE